MRMAGSDKTACTIWQNEAKPLNSVATVFSMHARRRFIGALVQTAEAPSDRQSVQAEQTHRLPGALLPRP